MERPGYEANLLKCSYYVIQECVLFPFPCTATTDYLIGTTHIMNGPSLVNSVLSLTPKYRPTKLWENQLDDQGPPPPKARPQVGGGAGATRSRSGAMN